jgi:hypothetical protein
VHAEGVVPHPKVSSQGHKLQSLSEQEEPKPEAEASEDEDSDAEAERQTGISKKKLKQESRMAIAALKQARIAARRVMSLQATPCVTSIVACCR